MHILALSLPPPPPLPNPPPRTHAFLEEFDIALPKFIFYHISYGPVEILQMLRQALSGIHIPLHFSLL